VPTPLQFFHDYPNEEITNFVGTEIIQQGAEVEKQFAVRFERVRSVPSDCSMITGTEVAAEVNERDQPSFIEEKPKGKKVNVTVTVVSFTGLHIQACSKPKKGFMAKKNTNRRFRELSSPPTTPSTTITASFATDSAIIEKNGKHHVTSLPVQFSDASALSPVVVHWPKQDEASTSYHYQQEWLHEEDENNTFANKRAFKPCIVHLAIIRSGRMINLGRAEVFGDKVGESFINIPITDKTLSTGKPTRFGKGKKVKLMKLKGEDLKCGLGAEAVLRVRVHVSEPFCDDPETTLFLQYVTPPSRVRSPHRVGSIKKSFSTSTGYYTHGTDTTSQMSSESSQHVSSSMPNQTMIPLQVEASSHRAHDEEGDNCSASMGSYSNGSDLVSSLSDNNTFFEYDRRLTWRHLFMCNFPVCGVIKQECTDIRRSTLQDTYDEEDYEPTLPSHGSSYVPW